MQPTDAIHRRTAQLLGLPEPALELVAVPGHPQVWKVLRDSHPIGVVKQLPPPGPNERIPPVSVAAQVLQLTSPPAVPYRAHCERLHLLVIDWVGEHTFDQICQQHPERAEIYTAVLIRDLVRLEGRFAAERSALLPLAYPLDYPRYLRSQLDASIDLAAERYTIPTSILDFMEEQLLNAAPTLGPLDCNAQNVMSEGERMWFIDLTRIGWGWPEQRLVQYGFCLGPSGGRPIHGLTRSTVGQYATSMAESRHLSPAALACLVDIHVFLATLLVAERVRQSLQTPELRQQWDWDAPERRWESLRELLERPLSDEPRMEEARRQARERFQLSPM